MVMDGGGTCVLMNIDPLPLFRYDVTECLSIYLLHRTGELWTDCGPHSFCFSLFARNQHSDMKGLIALSDRAKMHHQKNTGMKLM